MTTTGIDYSGSIVYMATVKDNKVLHISSVVKNEDTLLFMNMLESMLSACRNVYNSQEQIYIEQAWVNGAHFPKSGLMLARMEGLIEVAALRSNFKTNFIHPMQWRKKVYGKAQIPTPKESAINLVKKRFNYDVPVMGATGRGKTPDHNFAEAILIASAGEMP